MRREQKKKSACDRQIEHHIEFGETAALAVLLFCAHHIAARVVAIGPTTDNGPSEGWIAPQ